MAPAHLGAKIAVSRVARGARLRRAHPTGVPGQRLSAADAAVPLPAARASRWLAPRSRSARRKRGRLRINPGGDRQSVENRRAEGRGDGHAEDGPRRRVPVPPAPRVHGGVADAARSFTLAILSARACGKSEHSVGGKVNGARGNAFVPVAPAPARRLASRVKTAMGAAARGDRHRSRSERSFLAPRALSVGPRRREPQLRPALGDARPASLRVRERHGLVPVSGQRRDGTRPAPRVPPEGRAAQPHLRAHDLLDERPRHARRCRILRAQARRGHTHRRAGRLFSSPI